MTKTIEEILGELNTPTQEYATVEQALERIADARLFQIGVWDNTALTDGGGRPFEEWMVLLRHYQTKLEEVYTVSDGRTAEGNARVAKYSAIVGNLALWLVQAAQGRVQGQKAKALTFPSEWLGEQLNQKP
jgi:hypothetical protein